MVFKDFSSIYAQELEAECIKAKRTLKGNFTQVPELNIDQEMDKIDLADDLKEQIKIKAKQYYTKLQKLETKHKTNS